jgi:hypothetical protein
MKFVDVHDKLLTRALLEAVRQSRPSAGSNAEPLDVINVEAPCSVAVVLFPIDGGAWAMRIEAEDGFWVQLGLRPRPTAKSDPEMKGGCLCTNGPGAEGRHAREVSVNLQDQPAPHRRSSAAGLNADNAMRPGGAAQTAVDESSVLQRRETDQCQRTAKE